MPAAVREMLAEYRHLQRESSWDWGLDWRANPLEADEIIPCRLPVALARLVTGRPELVEVAKGLLDEAEALRRVLASVEPPGASSLIVLRPGQGPEVRSGPSVWALSGTSAPHWLVVDSRLDVRAIVHVNGEPSAVEAHELLVLPIEVPPGQAGFRVALGGDEVVVADVVERVEAATLVLHADASARWSVEDDRGGAWFPADCLRKWDGRFQPYFHGQDVAVEVPAVPLTMTATRGVECDAERISLTPQAGSTRRIELAPRRRFDPNAWGWFSADLHVHPNYSGDLVVTPDDVARMQVGEGLNVMNVLAANLYTTRIYDREAFEATVGEDLPWSGGTVLARYGIEYRNDLLGHFHALAPGAPPARYQTGHVPGEGQEDWPSNAVACAEQRGFGATVGYAHPVWRPFGEDGSPDSVFEPNFRGERSVEARELVVDAALGLVDSLDLLHPGDWDATAQLYHHLLGCGIRLAASVGTDSFLSISHGLNSDPPGWARMYAHLDGQALSVDAYKRAIREGRTIVTNGPWIRLAVAGRGPGAVIDAARGDLLELVAECSGPGVLGVEILGPDGVITSVRAVNEHAAVRSGLTVTGPLWIAARAVGVEHPSVQRGPAAAHTSPVYVDVAGRRVARPADARWCLDWLDRFDGFVRRYGRYQVDSHRDDVLGTIERAREVYRAVIGGA
jgi:hypothetical protein